MHSSPKIAIIGGGLMGCGIAQVFACHDLQVHLYEPNTEVRDGAKQKISENLALISKPQRALDFITLFEHLDMAVIDADIIIEAAPEKLTIKRAIFSELKPLIKPDAIVASNTSVIPIKDIFSELGYQDRVVGTHWWNPPYLVPLVEVVQSQYTSQQTIDSMMDLLKQVGKEPVHVQKDVAGFVGNRMQHALWREAIALIDAGVCSPEGIDKVVKNSFGLRLPQLGPIENADLVGLDLTLDIHNVILSEINHDPQPANILNQKVNAGELGMKTGQGFLNWTEEEAQRVKTELSEYLLKVEQQKQE